MANTEHAAPIGAADLRPRFVGLRADGDRRLLDVSVRGAITSVEMSREDYDRMRGARSETAPVQWSFLEGLLRVAEATGTKAGDVLGAARAIAEVNPQLTPGGILAIVQDLARVGGGDRVALADAVAKLTKSER